VDWHAGLAHVHTHSLRIPRDVKRGILGGSGSHHLSQLAYIIRHGNNPVEYDASYVEVNTT
jgi:hypothetical protein